MGRIDTNRAATVRERSPSEERDRFLTGAALNEAPRARPKADGPGGASDSAVVVNDLLVVPRYVEALRAAGLDCLDALFEAPRAELLTKPGLNRWRERLRLSLDIEGRKRTCYLKRFTLPPAAARRAVRRAGRGAASHAGLEWDWTVALRRDGIPCPEPIAFGEDLAGRRERRSALLTLGVPGESLERLARPSSGWDRGNLRGVMRRVAALVGRFHELGYVHRDLYLSHLFLDGDSQSERSVHLIDLQRVLKPGHGLRRWIVKDLAALNYSTPFDVVSRVDRIRWLKYYLHIPKLDASARRLAYRIVGKAEQIAAHDRRRIARAS